MSTNKISTLTKTIKVMFLNEANHMINELLSSRWIVDQPAVLVTLAVIPTSQGKSDLDSMFLEFSNLPIHILSRVT